MWTSRGIWLSRLRWNDGVALALLLLTNEVENARLIAGRFFIWGQFRVR